jgi:hypothetical protein
VVPPEPEKGGQATGAAAASECEAEAVQGRQHRIGWVRLLKRVFDIDVQHCPSCGAGEFEIISAILERPVIEKILTHLGLDLQPPPRARRRASRCGIKRAEPHPPSRQDDAVSGRNGRLETTSPGGTGRRARATRMASG